MFEYCSHFYVVSLFNYVNRVSYFNFVSSLMMFRILNMSCFYFLLTYFCRVIFNSCCTSIGFLVARPNSQAWPRGPATRPAKHRKANGHQALPQGSRSSSSSGLAHQAFPSSSSRGPSLADKVCSPARLLCAHPAQRPCSWPLRPDPCCSPAPIPSQPLTHQDGFGPLDKHRTAPDQQSVSACSLGRRPPYAEPVCTSATVDTPITPA